MITQSLLSQYRREVESASNDARNYLTAMCEAYLQVNPNATVADMRNFAISTIQDGLYMYGDQAKVIANDFFDTLAQQEGSKATAEMFDSTDPDMIEAKVRYYAGALAEGDTSKFIKDVSDLTGFYVKREAFCNMAKNCDRLRVRYARVPSGRETCAFCFMLASRGFVYWTEESAGESHQYHSHCDCIIVPGFSKDSGVNPDAQIEGYEPSKMYKRYKKCYDTINPDGAWSDVYEEWKKGETDDTWAKFKQKAIVKEINTRDWHWLWSGKPASYTKEKGAKPLLKEQKTSEILAKEHGIANKALKEINKNNVKTPDASIRGDKWELKIPDGWSESNFDNVRGEQTIRRAFHKAQKKCKQLIISNVSNEVNFNEFFKVVKKVFRSNDFQIDEVLIVGKDSELRRLSK